MRIIWAVLATGCAFAQQAPFTLEQILGASFPSSLAASREGGKVAWVSNVRGVHSIVAAAPPEYQGRIVATYTTDDGQDLSGLQWTPDGTAIVYVRSDGSNGAGEYPNPALDPKGVEQAVWIAGLDGSAPRRIGEGNSPAVSTARRPAPLPASRTDLVGAGGRQIRAVAGVSRPRDVPARQLVAGRQSHRV
jgi:hypothetical protein